MGSSRIRYPVGLIQTIATERALEPSMELKTIRIQALSLPEVTEEPHFNYSSFRVRGKIFITVPPDEAYAHLFVGEQDREAALAMYPDFIEKLMWGTRVLGLRVALAKAKASVVADLVRKAWHNKAPKRLAATVAGRLP
jgi:hypothetical protein